MIYIHQVGCINYNDPNQTNIKADCKLVAPKYIRRTDDFIQLAILGVEQIQRRHPIESNTALYLTSGQGNLGVFQRLCDQRFIEKSPPKPVDFINSLSNTAGFYVSQFLNLDSKNSNLSHVSFVVEMALLLAKNDLLQNKEQQVLLGGVDQLLQPSTLATATLGLPNSVPVGQGSNWMLLNKRKEGALACLELNNTEMDIKQLSALLSTQKAGYQLAFSLLIAPQTINAILQKTEQSQFNYEKQVGFYETVALYALNQFILNEKGRLIFIDYFQGKYRVIQLDVL